MNEELLTMEETKIPDILLSLDSEYIEKFQPFVKRYFTEMYCTVYSTKEMYDTCVRIHNNGLCLVYLSDNHLAVRENKQVKKVNLKISDAIDRTKNIFTGKRKKGAQVVRSDSILCFLEFEDGSTHPVYAGVPGRLLEINAKLEGDKQIIINHNNSDGYIAIIQPDSKNAERFSKLISADIYHKK